jgi:cyanophycinase
MGYILLEGGAEFGGQMEVPDRRALELAGGSDAILKIIPTAAAPDNNHRRAGQSGVSWFKSLGATNVTSLPLIDRKSANDSSLVEILCRSRLIYMLGGFPHYLEQTLTGSPSWQAMLTAHDSGAVIGGSSAGAMVLCEHYYDPFEDEVYKGLGLVPGTCILPHHDTFGRSWAARLLQELPEAILIGIDEQTGMLNDAPGGHWQVYGRGMVTLYGGGRTKMFRTGQPFSLAD